MGMPARRVGPLTEVGSEVILDETTLGYRPGEMFNRHLLQGTNLGGGTWAVDVLGPANQWTRSPPASARTRPTS